MGQRLGRPSIRTAERRELILTLISEGGLIRETCAKAGISASALCEWEHEDQDFANALARARETWARITAEDGAALVAKEPRMIVGEDGSERVDPGWVAHMTSRLNYQKWMIGRYDPKRFGDAAPTTNVTVGVSVNGITEEQRAEILAKKQEAIQWQRQHKLTNGTNGTNGSH